MLIKDDFPTIMSGRLICSFNSAFSFFKTDLSITKELLNKYRKECQDKGILIVSESGIFTRNELDKVYSYGADAVLVGESLMRQKDIKLGLNKLINGGS